MRSAAGPVPDEDDRVVHVPFAVRVAGERGRFGGARAYGTSRPGRAAARRPAARPPGRSYGCTTILRPTPALNWSIASGYCSRGSRSLMKTAGSRTPLAKSAAARS